MWWTPYTFPTPLQALFPRAWYRLPAGEQVLYLTFDDGPSPGITPRVLDILQAYEARASFFVIGDKLQRYPRLGRRIAECGHRLGNHTFHHLKGWETPLPQYLDNIRRTQLLIDAIQPRTSRPLFRPPHGQLTRRQYRALLPGYRIVMWKKLSMDFDRRIAPGRSIRRLRRVTAGDIIVFHDSRKAWPALRVLLPALLDHWSREGFRFRALL